MGWSASSGQRGTAWTGRQAEQARERIEGHMMDYENRGHYGDDIGWDHLRAIERELVEIQRVREMTDDDRRLLSEVRTLLYNPSQSQSAIAREEENYYRELQQRTNTTSQDIGWDDDDLPF